MGGEGGTVRIDFRDKHCCLLVRLSLPGEEQAGSSLQPGSGLSRDRIPGGNRDIGRVTDRPVLVTPCEFLGEKASQSTLPSQPPGALRAGKGYYSQQTLRFQISNGRDEIKYGL